jgi:ubiquitin carboxyl-terminal hydrolase 2/21
MNRQGSQYGTSYQPATRSSIYDRSSRPMPSTNNGSAAALIRSINSGSMSISTTNPNRTRLTSRLSQPSPERHIRVNTTTTTTQRRLPSQDRSRVGTNGIVNSTTERYLPNQTVTLYSIESYPESTDNETTKTKISSVDRRSSLTTNESKLMNGGLCGLQNLGNTCFMNSVLQCLSNTKPLLLFCLRDNLENELNTSATSVMKGVLMKEYANLIRKMWLLPEGRLIVSPLSFKNTIGKFAPRFTGYSEQDSQEFLRYLLQGLSEDVNRIRQKPIPTSINEKEEERMKEKDRAKLSWDRCLRYENSPLVDIFAGQLKSTLECSHCGYKSITFDMFWDLSLPLPRDRSSTDLQECIQLFMSKEELDGNEKPMCAKCKQKRPCTKKLSLQKCPEILVLHLKRFSQMRGRTKLNTYVDFPITNLKLNGIADVMSDSHEGLVPTYNLFGISNHSGSIYTGHYIAQCKHPFTHEWHEFNDSSVHLISDNSRIISANAYVLFYERNRS